MVGQAETNMLPTFSKLEHQKPLVNLNLVFTGSELISGRGPI